ncbi:MAG: GatB/YqeY domain-containing protein, partial [Elusimicrobiales bacterium]|nr:GatB/YqeY domain-containing protein [Elusimicrobiales bacterium]
TIQIIKSEIKKRKDSITAYTEGGRTDLAKKEEAELETLSKYMPEQMSEEAVNEVVKKIVSGLDDAGPTDFGRVMGQAMKELKGQADGTVVSEAVKKALNK